MNEGLSTYVSFVDMEKAFDWVDHDLLLYKLLSYNADGNFYFAIKAMYECTISSVRINSKQTPWFETRSGVRQGDTLWPSLFNVFLNDFIQDVNLLNCRIEIDDIMLSTLLYADDVILIAPT